MRIKITENHLKALKESETQEPNKRLLNLVKTLFLSYKMGTLRAMDLDKAELNNLFNDEELFLLLKDFFPRFYKTTDLYPIFKLAYFDPQLAAAHNEKDQMERFIQRFKPLGIDKEKLVNVLKRVVVTEEFQQLLRKNLRCAVQVMWDNKMPQIPEIFKPLLDHPKVQRVISQVRMIEGWEKEYGAKVTNFGKYHYGNSVSYLVHPVNAKSAVILSVYDNGKIIARNGQKPEEEIREYNDVLIYLKKGYSL
jgi:hypothetical protein